jgi:dipeptidyl-peptidase-4
VDWTSNAAELVVQQFNRIQNTNLVLWADARTGRTRTVLTEIDDAWVENSNTARWVKEGKEFLWLSERSGWRRAYRVSNDGEHLSRITRDKMDVMAIDGLDEEKGWLYFDASPGHATQRYLYRVPLAGGKATRVTPVGQAGSHSYNLSPDAHWAIHTWSSFTNPPVTELVRLPMHAVMRVLEDNHKLRENLDKLAKPGCEFFRIGIDPKVTLDGWCLSPPGFDPEKKYPVVFYVYGEPGGQTVLDAWRGNSLLWHWMLAQRGYFVISLDSRGTPAPRGRAWRKSIHRQIGTLNSADQAAAVRALLRQRRWLDPARVGVWGWSGGGSSTLHAILQYPDLYHTAMAVAPVPNQRYYDSIYQERYMGMPTENSEGYRQGSAITYASQLKGNLLIVHGTGDDNVHFQGTEALINELVRYDKLFTMMAYPNRTHSINEGKNTTRHLYELLTRYLTQNLPANPTPGAAAP